MQVQRLSYRRSPVLVVLSSLVLTTLLTWGKQSSPVAADNNSDLMAFMRKKLDASTQILEGLTVEDA